MAIIEQVKKGGRYTKKEQEERRLQVHHLHFDENKSAVEIAEILNVNRNTVNDDIKFWLSRFVNKSNELDVYSKMTKQIQRMEIQRDRFFEYLEEADTLYKKMFFEKQISDIDNKLTQIFTKIILMNNHRTYGFKFNKN